MTIETYLAELAQRLPRARRKRFLTEAEDHLRDAARAHRRRGLDPDAAEHAAVAGFGDVDLVARRLAAVAAVSSLRRASALAVAAALALVLPLYGIPENTLPPATWAAKPAAIAVLQGATLGLWLVALVLGCAGFLLAVLGHGRLVPFFLGSAVAATAAFLVVGVALFAVWLDEAPTTPIWPFLGLALPAAVVCLGASVAASWRARESARALAHDLGQD